MWENEKVPKKWNKGSITSIWKGKGDKEKLQNHRGITTSSAIGTIMDTDAQGGGKKGASTCDHLFISRIMDISKKDKKST